MATSSDLIDKVNDPKLADYSLTRIPDTPIKRTSHTEHNHRTEHKRQLLEPQSIVRLFKMNHSIQIR